MKNNIRYYTFLIVLLLSSHQGSGQGKLLRGEKWGKFSDAGKTADFYVAPGGNDHWSGTLAEANAAKTDGPFATINRAQMAVRSLKTKVYVPKSEPVETRWIGSPHPFGKGKDILVYIREGYYTLEEPLVFNPEDGGERIETNLPSGAFEYHKLKDHYVTYAAYPGENPVISGGLLLHSWEKERSGWKIRNLDAPVQMLVVDGRKQTLARTPDTGYFVPPVLSETPDKLYFNRGDIRQWKEMEGNRVFMLLRWHHGKNSISRVDERTGTAWLSKPEEGVVIVPPRYYIENVKSLMDAPGEWFYDQKQKELSYIPLSSQVDLNMTTVSAPQINELIVVRGEPGRPVRNLRMYGLSFEATLPGSSALIYEYAHGCELVGSTFRSCGGTGISVRKGCYQTRILDNTFQYVDNMAISIHGPEGPANGKDILRETTVSHNRFMDCGGNNIDASYSLFTTISHNYITKTRGRYAISVGGWSNLEEAIDGGYLVEYNHLDDVQKDADDSGAIKTAGMTFNSIVRRNLVHDVRAGYFNDNVGFWFDNMSLGWLTEKNIFYNLEQGEMKLCAANLVDNIYRNNYVIEAPEHAPEQIICGDPVFQYSDLKISAFGETDPKTATAGTVISVSAIVFNGGASGINPVELYLDGKITEKKSFPVISNNSRRISFELRIYDAGPHTIAIGNTAYENILIEGEKPAVVFEDMHLSDRSVISGETIKIKVLAKNLLPYPRDEKAELFLNNEEFSSQFVSLGGNESREISFEISPGPGKYVVRIVNSNEIKLIVSDWVKIEPDQEELFTYCSAKAKPCDIKSDPGRNSYKITAGGSDFFHAEDSYATIFMKKIKGDFVATVKINEFGDRTHEWFRAGLFVRNDMTESFDTQPGSKGSMLLFGTPGRAGIEYDEFGNGCMHKANSQNLPEETKFPIWLKLVRHGNSFTGTISLDGKTWINEKRSNDLPGLAEAIDLGLAAGSPDKKQYWVEFEDWTIKLAKPANDQFSYAQERKDDLQLSIYVTAHAVKNLLSDEAGRREAISIFRRNGITKAYIEVYRGGLVIEKRLLQDVRDLFEQNQIEVVGGIATVPGENFGVRQEAQLGWFNWQNPKTQTDLKEVMMMSADVFDEFIIDDFLCTADTSMESKAAKGERSWSRYRRDLLTELSESLFIDPARSVNPDITMIIKYPQWYDRFHLFGYDVENKTALYDKVCVGTESRGQYTQRFGFVQPYESFVSYRWMKSLAGKKMSGAWFDHGDCDENDFVEQAWQSVLAGARELIFFNYFDFVNGHKGHHLMRIQFTQLADLARKVATEPVKGVMAYKPASSSAYGDLYIMDFIGMLGVPLIPVSQYPENARVIFLPTQAAADTEILAKIENSITSNATLIFTTGFLAHAKDGKRLAEIAGISWPLVSSPFVADRIVVGGEAETIKYGLDLESNIQLTKGDAKLVAVYNSDEIPFLVARENIFTLNTHTFSQADFDEVGEVLLCPRPLGLLEISETWANTLRDQFLTPLGLDFNAPARVTLQPCGDSGWVIHNYNRETVRIGLSAEGMTKGTIEDKFSGRQFKIHKGQIDLEIPPRSRVWLEIDNL